MENLGLPTARCDTCGKFWPLEELSRLWMYMRDEDRPIYAGQFCGTCGDCAHEEVTSWPRLDTLVWKAY